MALRFGSQSLASGLLLAAHTALIGTLITGTGDFSVAIAATQSGQGTVSTTQQVAGTGAHSVALTTTQTGSGRLPQIVYNTGSTIEWGQSIGVSQGGDGESAPPQQVAGTGSHSASIAVSQDGTGTVDQPLSGTGAFSAALQVSQSGDGTSVIPPQTVAGTADFSAAISVSQDGAGESVTPAQVVHGGGAFVLTLGVTQSGDGGSEVPEDTTPNPFPFTHQSGVALEATITSAPVTITGINAPSPITVSGGTYSINGGAFTASAGNVEDGDEIQARHTASDAYLTTVTTTVTVGGVSAQFRSRTRRDPDAPVQGFEFVTTIRGIGFIR